MAKVGRPPSRTATGTRAPTNELGSALTQVGGNALTPSGQVAPWSQFIDETEYVPELMWPASIATYNQMRSDSQLAALLTAVVYGISQLRYVLDPNGANPKLVKEVSEDLNVPIQGKESEPKGRLKRRFSHSKHVGQALLAAIYGYAFFEQVGDIVDGKFRLRKLANRPQNSIAEIAVAPDGGLVYIKQWTHSSILPNDNKPIPVDRLTAYVFQQENYNWTGRSMLRDCYKDWLIKDRLVRIDAINHERAGGVPYIEAPMGATVAEIEDLDVMAQRFRIGDSAGAAMPFGAKLNIAKGTGSDVNKSIQRCDESMARRFLLMLANLAQGGQHVGSYALAESFEDFFVIGQRAIANWYCDITNEHVIEDIADWNYGEDEELVPRLTWERTSEDSLGIDQLATLVQRGVIIMDDDLENAVRYKYQLPKRPGPRPPEVVGPGVPKQPPEVAPGAGAPAGEAAPSQQPSPATKKPKTKTTASHAPFDWANDPEYGEPHVMAKASEPALVTVPNVPIIECGVEYTLSTGPTTFTPEDLRDMVTAENEDFAIKSPRVKIGHIDPRYNAPEFDGAPAFGKFTNLRLSDNGMVVYADAVGVPKWLADIMPSAFPSRSVEGFWNIETQTGHKWRFVCTAVSALGVYWPGVTVLEDLPAYYGAERPPDVVVDEEEQLLVAASQPGGGPMKVRAAANLDDIRRAFYNEYIPEHQSEGTMMWWVRAVMTDPNQLVVEDDSDGQLYLLPFESDAKGTVSFGSAEPVRIDYVPDNRESKKAAASAMATVLGAGRKVLASWPSRAESRPETTAGGAMDPKEIRQRLGLPEDASDEQVRDAAAELGRAAGVQLAGEQQPAGTPVSTNPGGTGTTGTGTGEAAPVTEEQQQQARRESGGAGAEGEQLSQSQARFQVPDGMVLLDAETANQLRHGAQAGLELKRETDKSKREQLVAAAIGDGRIPAARRDFWLNGLEKDPEGFAQSLASLEPGLVPVGEMGHAGSENADLIASDMETVSGWTANLFPETAARKQQKEAVAASGRYPLIMTDAGFGEPGFAEGVLGR